jgi:hypothetical protein
VTAPLRALRALVDRAFATPVPATFGRICPGGAGGAHGLDFNCREIAFEDGIQLVQCATCGIRSTWAWGDKGPILVARQVAPQVAA